MSETKQGTRLDYYRQVDAVSLGCNNGNTNNDNDNNNNDKVGLLSGSSIR